ncbi:MAG: hypothetical protein ABIR94_23485 [Rubrivivax sp.]
MATDTSAAHTVTQRGPKGQRSELMLKGQTATLQFDEAGSIAYVCGLHPGMKGTGRGGGKVAACAACARCARA